MTESAEEDLFLGDLPGSSITYPEIPYACEDTSKDPFRPMPSTSNFGNCNQVSGDEEDLATRLNDQDHGKQIFKYAEEDPAKMINDFVIAGGQYYIAPKLQETEKDGLQEETTNLKIHFLPGDVAVPICHEGMNRSQILYLALHAFKKRCNVDITIARPHGAETGFDPYVDRYKTVDETLNSENVHDYIHGVMLPKGSEGEWLHDNFYSVFHTEKSKRIGAFEPSSSLNEDDTLAESDKMFLELAQKRYEQRQKMDTILFSPNNLRARLTNKSRNKVILFCFCRAGDIILKRILEHKTEGCENICIVALPWFDNISRAGGKDQMKRYHSATGNDETRDYISIMRHISVFKLYSSILTKYSASKTTLSDNLFVGMPPPDTFKYPNISNILCKNNWVDPFRPAPDPLDTNNLGNCNLVGTETNAKRLELSCKTFGFKSLIVAKEEIDNFVQFGGQYYVAPVLDETINNGFKSTVITDNGFRVHILPGDVVIPVCHEGVNRSQVLFLALQAFKKRCGVNFTIARPHGAESGFDPYQAYENIDSDSVYGYLNGVMLPRGSEGEWLHDNFYNLFGTEKSKRVGDLGTPHFLNPVETNWTSEMFAKVSAARTKQRLLMDSLLFSPTTLRNRLANVSYNKVIFFCFCRASSIVLQRILEQKQNCQNICIVALPWGDDIARAGGEDELDAIFKATKTKVDRDTVSIWRQEHVFTMYSTILAQYSNNTALMRAIDDLKVALERVSPIRPPNLTSVEVTVKRSGGISLDSQISTLFQSIQEYLSLIV